MTWLEDTSLRDLDDSVIIESTCIGACTFGCKALCSFSSRLSHRDVRLDEVARHLACPKSGCRHVGVRLTLINNEDTSSFVGGMP